MNYTADACSGCTGRRGAFGAEGFSLGMELSIDQLNKLDRKPVFKGIAGFGHSFLDGAIDIYFELNHTYKWRDVISGRLPSRPSVNPSVSHWASRCLECGDPNHIGNGQSNNLPHDYDANPQSLYYNLMIGYNLGLGFDDETTLSFILQNEIDELIISPRFGRSNNIRGVFTPSVRLNHELNTGDIYTQIGIPITYIQNNKNADTEINLEFTLGWNSLLGLQLETVLFTQITPIDSAGFDALAFLIGYDINAFNFSVDTFFPLSEISRRGINITPLIGYTFRGWTFNVNCAINHIGAQWHVTPAFGISYKF